MAQMRKPGGMQQPLGGQPGAAQGGAQGESPFPGPPGPGMSSPVMSGFQPMMGTPPVGSLVQPLDPAAIIRSLTKRSGY